MQNIRARVKFRIGLLLLILLTGAHTSVESAVIYVDNRAGNNALNGFSPKITNGNNGPVKTIQRALEYAKPGDKIILTNNQIPYQETISLAGKRFCGIGREKFTILGNGATLSGAIPVPPKGWKNMGDGLWKVTPFRKGFYNLFLDGKPVSEYQPGKETPVSLKNIPAGKWAVFQGAIYYREQKNQQPFEQHFTLAGKSVGLSLVDVSGVHISDLIIENFRVDGINVHDRCKDITLENITSTGNGRCGLSVNGTSQVEVIDSKLLKNRVEDLLITEQGVAELKQTQLGKEVKLTP